MNLDQRIQAFSSLGKYISDTINQTKINSAFETILRKAESQNPWFTRNNIFDALRGIVHVLNYNQLHIWIYSYSIENAKQKNVAVVMAGNIPLVGFHDALCVLITGNYLHAKLSSKDTILMKFIFDSLISIEPEFEQYITIHEGFLQEFDAIISTGSDNSARYFEYYFKKYPHIIRKNRNSIAVIRGNESNNDLQKLGKDIFQYFGLGCRNVSKIYIPEDYDITKIIDNLENYATSVSHNKYMNNYEYNKSIYLVTQQAHLDNGFILFKEDSKISSPLAVVFYEKYSNFADVQKNLEINKDFLQCIVCNDNLFYKENVLPGYTQTPNVWDYADNIDTISFLLKM